MTPTAFFGRRIAPVVAGAGVLAGLAGASIFGWTVGPVACIAGGVLAALVWGWSVAPALRTRSGAAAANRWATVALAVTAFVLASYLNHRLVRARVDMTPGGTFSLSAETLRRIDALTDPVDVTLIESPGDVAVERLALNDEIAQLLGRYEEASAGKVRVRRFQSAREEAEAAQFIRTLGLNPREQVLPIVFVQCGERHRRIAQGAFAKRIDDFASAFRGEALVTNAIIEVTTAKTPRLYFTVGSGEGDTLLRASEGFSRLRDMLGERQLASDVVNLDRTGSVPADCDLLVMLGPERDLTPRAASAVERYLASGGRLFAFVESAFEIDQPPAALARILRTWGIALTDAVAFDFDGNEGDDASLVRVDEYGPGLQALVGLPSIFLAPRVLRSVADDVAPPAGRDIDGFVVLRTSARAFGETDVARLRASHDYEYHADVDLAGPVAFGVAVEELGDGDGDRPPTRIVAIGDVFFASNHALARFPHAAQTHLDLVGSLVDWLLLREPRVRIPPRVIGFRRLSEIHVSDRTIRALVWGGTLGLPLVVLAVGSLVWWWRRRW